MAEVRAGVGPALIHATVTRPYSHSSQDTQSKYRPADELAEEAAHDPLVLFEQALIDGGVLGPDDVAQIKEEARQTVLAAARAALWPPPAPTRRRSPTTWSPSRRWTPAAEAADDGTGEVVALGEAIRRTLHEQMAEDERIRVFGEDVADAREAVLANVEGKGGVFGTTFGLQREFGLARCYNTPLAEANIVGRAVGQALRGLRPIPEVQFFDYIWPAMHQIKSEAATIRWRSNGAFTCPMVLRVPIGGYVTGGAIWHSQSGRVHLHPHPRAHRGHAVPCRRRRGLAAHGAAGRGPVLFLEHKHLLRQPVHPGPVPVAGVPDPVRQGPSGGRRRRAHHRHVGRHGREVPPGRRHPRRPRTAARYR